MGARTSEARDAIVWADESAARRPGRSWRARELLRHTDVSIINISLECGYGNPAHFATAFRRSVGMSPSDYRAG